MRINATVKKRSYFLSRKFLFDKVKVCTFTAHIYVSEYRVRDTLCGRSRKKLSESEHF